MSIHFCFGLPSGIFPRGFHFNTAFIRLYDLHAWPAHAILLYCSTATMFGSLYSCCHSMLFLLSYCCVVLFRFGPYILLNIRLSKVAFFSSSHLVIGHVSQAYERTGLIITLYSVIFNLIDTCFDLNTLVNP